MEVNQVPAQVSQTLTKAASKKVWPFVLGGFLVVLAGVVSAWGISRSLVKGTATVAGPGAKVTANGAGTLDPKVKYDTATGVIAVGGLNNEGTYHLVRDGGPSKYVYLTSSVIDLGLFVDKKVNIWGETLASKKVGWLMDVAKVQVVQ